MGNYSFLIFVAILGGISLGVNRSLMGIVGKNQGSIESSVINHLSGALFLVFLVLGMTDPFEVADLKTVPLFAFVGGIIGAFFVIIISFVLPKIGVLKTSVLLISGQVLFSTIIDLLSGSLKSVSSAVIGVILILSGVALGFYSKKIK